MRSALRSASDRAFSMRDLSSTIGADVGSSSRARPAASMAAANSSFSSSASASRKLSSALRSRAIRCCRKNPAVVRTSRTPAAAGRLRPGGRLVLNLVTLDHLAEARACLDALGWPHDVTQLSVARSTPIAGSVRLAALNPVFILSAERPR